MHLESKIVSSVIGFLLGLLLSYLESKISKREVNRRDHIKIGFISGISVFMVLYFQSNKIVNTSINQTIRTGNPNF